MTYQPRPGMTIEELDTPALLVDLDALDRNIQRMADFFADKPVSLRPHSKTHKCPQVAQRQLEAGAIGITCAKVGEAEVMAGAGIRDILIANQVVGPVKIDRLTDLARECDPIVAVDDPVNVKALSQACTAKGVELRVLVEVDVGNKRCGVPPHESTLKLAQRVSDAPNLRFAGLMAYEGFLVALEDPEERARRVQETFAPLQETYDLLLESGLPVEIVSGGATATYDVTAACPPITEIEAGSYVFMDSFYLRRRPEFELALTVLSTVVSRPVPERVLLDVGHKSMTSELGLPQALDMEGLTLNRLAEEHAWLTVTEPERVQCRPGDKMRLMPSHCCTEVNLYDALHVVQDGVLVDVWPVAARGRSQ